MPQSAGLIDIHARKEMKIISHGFQLFRTFDEILQGNKTSYKDFLGGAKVLLQGD
jgi:hypothetical protein